MKKLVLILCILPLIGFSQKADTIMRFDTSGGTSRYKYREIHCDNIYLSGIYQQKAGRNLIAAGAFLGFSVLSSLVPMILPAEQRTTDLYLGCAITSAGFLILSITEFVVSGHQMKRAGIILRSGKNYVIEARGMNIRIKF